MFDGVPNPPPPPPPLKLEGEGTAEPPATPTDTESGSEEGVVLPPPIPIPTWLTQVWSGKQLPPAPQASPSRMLGAPEYLHQIPEPTGPEEHHEHSRPRFGPLGTEPRAPKYKRHPGAKMARREAQAGTTNGDASVPARPAIFQRAKGAAATKSPAGFLALAACLLLAL